MASETQTPTTNSVAQSSAATSTSKPDTAPPCKFCSRPAECPKCSHPLSSPSQNGLKNISDPIQDVHGQLPEPLNLPQNPQFLHCLPPNEPKYRKFSLFTAGSIEMGKAVQWQQLLVNHIQDLPITVCNPRRGHWDPTITPEARNKDFRTQVEWELEALTQCTVICFFFDHATMSPVTMCELGLWAHSGKVVVCCDKQFWKSGNVHLVCERYRLPLVESFSDMMPLVRAMLRAKGMVVGSDGALVDEGSNKAAPDQMTLEQAKAYCEERIPALQGKAPTLNVTNPDRQ